MCFCRFDRFLCEDRTVHLMCRKSVECFGNSLIRQFQCLGDRLSLDHLGGHRARCDRRAAAESLKLNIRDNVIIYLQIDRLHG